MNNFESKSDTKVIALSCKCLIFKTKKNVSFYSEVDFLSFVILQDICNKFIFLLYIAKCQTVII